MTVVRYTPQAVLIANVEEARYRALASEDGRLLVEARYAVRNNQRSFLKVTLPAGSTVWSAKVGGRPIRPGVAERDAVLLPLEKGRAGEEAPTFVVELVYLQRDRQRGSTRGGRAIDLPALDLPVSRTGLELHYSPRFRVAPQPGAFRVEDRSGSVREALRGRRPTRRGRRQRDLTQRCRRGPPSDCRRSSIVSGTSPAAARSSGALPVHVTFPRSGRRCFSRPS